MKFTTDMHRVSFLDGGREAACIVAFDNDPPAGGRDHITIEVKLSLITEPDETISGLRSRALASARNALRAAIGPHTA